MEETEILSSPQNAGENASLSQEERTVSSDEQEAGSGETGSESAENSDSAGDNPELSPELSKEKSSLQKSPKCKHSAKYYAAVFFAKIAVTVLACWLLLTFVAGIYICHNNSSYPMIKDGDFCLTYRLAKLEQGDAVVYQRNGEICFGRVIAKTGDSVSIFNDYITVNDYGIYENTVYPTTPEGSKITYPYIVPENCVFVLNDYRNDLNDSRSFGGVPLDDVKGKIVFVMRRRGI